MTKTPSTMIPLGTIAPTFTLLDTVTNQLISLEQLKAPIATVIMFLCNHCPYVKLIQTKLVTIANEYKVKGVQFIAISSNDITSYPEDGPEHMHAEAINHQYPFPYLFDESQDVARAYNAACTPDFYIFDSQLACVYRGRFDDATPGNGHQVTGIDLVNALECIINGKSIDPNQNVSVGCNIKWKK